ncbi:uncharacterized protein LACBIDRAFT_297729 [Laccaria bicolor S238N-H82]|uniref:Predicted protein n=1 Tax=Laccaria bicolor (strain S238N-H82 / ATCC MYA-4686) TaxID=486041 RepID=B0DAQ5_LACBS|nr:uncharacterized protein LACBIDRAFT_297729 [Laccaria bicolor S238N-H82]EDR08067.1 predicted protein [Laccaria bicolor S238N-H82]|eukprot:XP_001881137.1 predicted protein [Laccaria bicolor S238N-H82]
MFSTALQPSIISLFSSTGSDPLALFSVHKDDLLPADSFVVLLHDRLSQPPPPAPAVLITLQHFQYQEDDSESYGYCLDQTVLHIQSPTITTTYIQSPPVLNNSSGVNGLGIKHPWIHLQVRNLSKEWAFEVGIVDLSARVGILRLSTFQARPRLKLSHNKPPVLHLPLSFPPTSSRLLTPWSTIALHLPTVMARFSTPSVITDHDDEECRGGWSSDPNRTIPMGGYSHVSHVRIYATCRLRRIWFGDIGPSQKVPWEFELYAD